MKTWEKRIIAYIIVAIAVFGAALAFNKFVLNRGSKEMSLKELMSQPHVHGDNCAHGHAPAPAHTHGADCDHDHAPAPAAQGHTHGADCDHDHAHDTEVAK